MNHKRKEEIISVIPLSYYECWCHEANCKQKSTGWGPQAVLERLRVWFPLLCPYLTVPAPYCTGSSSREWQKRGFSKKISVSLGGAGLCLVGADPLLTPLPLVHNPSGSQPQESSLAALWLAGWLSFLARWFSLLSLKLAKDYWLHVGGSVFERLLRWLGGC